MSLREEEYQPNLKCVTDKKRKQISCGYGEGKFGVFFINLSTVSFVTASIVCSYHDFL